MKLNADFLVHNTGDKTLLVPTAAAPFHGLVQGNKTVDEILSCLQKETTEEEIVRHMCEKFEADEKIIREDVRDVLSRLSAIGAIDDDGNI